MVSAGWRLVKLSEVCEIQRGGSPRPISDYITDAEDGINWIKIGDVPEGAKYIFTTKEKIKPEGAKRSRQVKSGDFLLSNSMSFGRPYILRTSGCIHDGWLVLRDKENQLNEDYLYHVLSSGFVYAQFKKFAVGAVVKNLNIEVVEKVEIPLPALPEQIRIAAILDQADALRVKRKEALVQLDNLTQSIFIDMFGEYRAGKIKWAVEAFDAIAKETKIGLVRNAEEFGEEFKVPYIRMNAIGRSGELFLNSVKRTDVTDAECDEFKLQQGDFLFNTRNSRELVGKTAVFRDKGLYVYNNNLMRVRFRSDIESEYVAAAFQTQYIQQELELRKAGTTNVFAIYYRELRSLPIPVPPTSLQCKFAQKVSSIQKLKTKHQASLNELDSLFASLQHRAFRGEL